MNQRSIEEALSTEWVGRRIFFQEETVSTNEDAKVMARREKDPHGLLLVADHQTGGRGSRGRSWVSPPESSISMSLVLCPGIGPDRISMLTLVAGLSVAEGIRVACGLPVGIKWPNDIVCEGKKLAGILTETVIRPEESLAVVIGIGINVNTMNFPPELSDKAGSIALCLKKKIEREGLIGAVLGAFEENFAHFMQSRSMQALRSGYEALLIHRGKMVHILSGSEAGYEALALGIDSLGRLRLVREEGQEAEVISSGEVSVRGVYGYV